MIAQREIDRCNHPHNYDRRTDDTAGSAVVLSCDYEQRRAAAESCGNDEDKQYIAYCS